MDIRPLKPRKSNKTIATIALIFIALFVAYHVHIEKISVTLGIIFIGILAMIEIILIKSKVD